MRESHFGLAEKHANLEYVLSDRAFGSIHSETEDVNSLILARVPIAFKIHQKCLYEEKQCQSNFRSVVAFGICVALPLLTSAFFPAIHTPLTEIHAATSLPRSTPFKSESIVFKFSVR